jgi:2-keto-3-deoxy-L-rhamnonate aldolase RhmA
MDVPSTPRQLFEQQVGMILDDIDTSKLSSAQTAIVTFLKGSSSVKDYVELSRLTARGAKGIYAQVRSMHNYSEQDADVMAMANRSVEIIEQIEELISELAFLNGLDH